MNYLSKLFSLSLMMISFQLSGSDTLVLNQSQFKIDVSKKLILVTEESSSLSFDEPIQYIALDQVYSFSEPIEKLSIGQLYTLAASEEYKLYFTNLPLISVETKSEIQDEPKVSADILIMDSKGGNLTSKVGIEYRGGWTQTLEKKSFRVEFWADSLGVEKKPVTLLGMRTDDDWNLQAMYNEPLRLRSKSSFNLWEQIDTLAYNLDEQDAQNGVDQRYVEVFINDNYRGVYALSEVLDRKQLKLKKTNVDTMNGELYKGVTWGATTFGVCPVYDNSQKIWSGFEFEYPSTFIDWGTVYSYVNFVVNSDSSTFYSSYDEWLEIDNAINYFIFLNLTRAKDNTGKNIYLAKYNQDSKYFYVPWDLDGTFGMLWNGEEENIFDDIFSNGLYDRLLKDSKSGGFVDRLKRRWRSLRTTIVQKDALMNLLYMNQEFLQANGVYEREKLAWPNYACNTQNLSYTETWISDRIRFLDAYFESLQLTNTEELTVSNFQVKLFPNPANEQIQVESLESPILLNIYDLNARLIKTVASEVSIIPTTELANGSYLLEVAYSNGRIERQIFFVNHN